MVQDDDGRRVGKAEDAFLLPGEGINDLLVHNGLDGAARFVVGAAHGVFEHAEIQPVLGAGVEEAPDAAVTGNVGARGGIDEDEDVAAVLVEEARRLDPAHVVVRVDGGNVAVLAFDGNERDAVGGQFHGGNGVGEDDQALHLVGQEFADVPALCAAVVAAGEDEELVAVLVVGGQQLFRDHGVEAVVNVRDDEADEFGLAVGENAGDLVFIIMKIPQRRLDLFPVLFGQGFGVVEVARNRRF